MSDQKPMSLDEDALRPATLLLNKRLAEGNLYGVTQDIIRTYLAALSAGSVVEGVMSLIEERLAIVWARPGSREFFAGELHEVLKNLPPADAKVRESIVYRAVNALEGLTVQYTPPLGISINQATREKAKALVRNALKDGEA